MLRGQLFSKENLNYLIVCITQCTLFFQHFFLFSIANMFSRALSVENNVTKHRDKLQWTEFPTKNTCLQNKIVIQGSHVGSTADRLCKLSTKMSQIRINSKHLIRIMVIW